MVVIDCVRPGSRPGNLHVRDPSWWRETVIRAHQSVGDKQSGCSVVGSINRSPSGYESSGLSLESRVPVVVTTSIRTLASLLPNNSRVIAGIAGIGGVVDVGDTAAEIGSPMPTCCFGRSTPRTRAPACSGHRRRCTYAPRAHGLARYSPSESRRRWRRGKQRPLQIRRASRPYRAEPKRVGTAPCCLVAKTGWWPASPRRQAAASICQLLSI